MKLTTKFLRDYQIFTAIMIGLFFAFLTLVVNSVLVSKVEDHKKFVQTFSVDFLKDLQLGNKFIVDAKIRRLMKSQKYQHVALLNENNELIQDLHSSAQTSNIFNAIAEKLPFHSFESELSDGVGTRFGKLKVSILPSEFYRSLLFFAGLFSLVLTGMILIFFAIYRMRINTFSSPMFDLVSEIKKLSELENVEAVQSATITHDRNRFGIEEFEDLRKIFRNAFLKYARSQEALQIAKKHEAVAHTTQSLAHDVRKPLTMVEMILDIAEKMPSGDEAKAFIQSAVPEIRQAKASVEGMLQDVMQIGSDSKPQLEETAVESLVNNCINEVFRVYPSAAVNLKYSFKHTGVLNIDTNRLSRVLSNIVGNAVQAMKPNETLSFSTRSLLKTELSEVERASGHSEFIEVRIKNTGSFIPQEHLAKLFEAFYTFKKRGGTGLGLAIAKKNVNEHGGSIRCESDTNLLYPNGFVEFVFTLPAKSNPNEKVSILDFDLPKHSSEIHAKISALRQYEPNFADTTEAQIEHELAQKLKEMQKNNLPFPKILMVDDEAVYRNAFEELLKRGNELVAAIPFSTASNSVSAYAKISEFEPTIVIQDIDLGPTSHTGLQIMKSLRSHVFSGKICVHSNRFFMGDQNEAIQAGADLVLPKPMSRAHLLKFILASLDTGSARRDLKSNLHASDLKNTPSSSEKLNFAYIDDSKTFLALMRMRVKGEAELFEFLSSTEFLERAQNDQHFLSSLHFVVTDYHFAPSDPHNGLSLAQELRRLGYLNPILLASDAEFTEGEVMNSDANKVIPKTIGNWAALRAEYLSVRKV